MHYRFFCLDFFLLFSDAHLPNGQQIFIDSFMIATLLLLIMGSFDLTFLLKQHNPSFSPQRGGDKLPLYDYLICFAIIIMLLCMACEYRIITLISKHNILSASALFFPLTLAISTILGERWGYKINLKLCLLLIVNQLIFNTVLMAIIALPSPAFLYLNPFYSYIILTRLPIASLSLFLAFMSNAMLLHYLKQPKWALQRPLRILIANICANSLLCFIDYSLLFGEIYPYELISSLVANIWRYKLLMTLVFLPLILWLCARMEKKKSLAALQYD